MSLGERFKRSRERVGRTFRRAINPASTSSLPSVANETIGQLERRGDTSTPSLKIPLPTVNKAASVSPPLGSAIGTLVGMMDIMDTMGKDASNQETYKELVVELNAALEALNRNLELHDEPSSDFAELVSSLEAQLAQINARRNRGETTRHLEALQDEEDLANLYSEARETLQQLQILLDRKMQENTAEHHVESRAESAPSSQNNPEDPTVLSLGAHCSMSLAEVVAEIQPVPVIERLVECLTLVFQAVEGSRVNKAQWKLLRGRCVMVVHIARMQVTSHAQNHPPGLEETVDLLRNTFNTIAKRAQHYYELKTETEFFQFEAMSEEIERLFVVLDSCLAGFLYAMDTAQSQWIEKFRVIQKGELAEMNRIRQKIVEGNNDGKHSKLDQTRLNKKRAESLRSNGMSAREMFECLKRHGCQDLTERVDMKTISLYPIATGAYGDIFKGTLDGSTDIAIKVWSFRRADEAPDKCLKGAMRELYNWSKADHENIQKLLGVVMFKDRLGMVSRWMSNGNLQDYIRRHEPEDRYQLCVQVTQAVQHLHKERMVHGDVKACNFLVSSDGVVKLTDFDHSIISCHSIVFSQTTTMGGGTMRWMAPELVMDEGEVELRSTQADVYALGMTLLEIITGTIPYPECQSDLQVFCKLSEKILPERTQHFQGERGEQLWKLLEQCWDHDPILRPSANQVVDSLLSLVSGMASPGDDIQLQRMN